MKVRVRAVKEAIIKQKSRVHKAVQRERNKKGNPGNMKIDDMPGILASLAGTSTDIADQPLPPAKKWSRRPAHWKDAARHFKLYKDIISTTMPFSDTLAHLTTMESKRSTLNRWVKELARGASKTVPHHGPIVGTAADTDVANYMAQRMAAGLA